MESIDEEQFKKATGNSLANSTVGKLVNQTLVKIDPRYFRPTEVDLLIGDPTKSKEKLGWEPKYDLPALVEDMMRSDIRLFQRDIHLLNAGHKVLNQVE